MEQEAESGWPSAEEVAAALENAIAAQPMTDERHLAAQQAVTAPEAEIRDVNLFSITANELLEAINSYMAALDDTLPRYEGELTPDNPGDNFYSLDLTDQVYLSIDAKKGEDTGNQPIYRCQIVVKEPATAADWELAKNYFFAISYCVDRNRPGNLVASLRAARGHWPIHQCSGLLTVCIMPYVFTGDIHLLGCCRLCTGEYRIWNDCSPGPGGRV